MVLKLLKILKVKEIYIRIHVILKVYIAILLSEPFFSLFIYFLMDNMLLKVCARKQYKKTALLILFKHSFSYHLRLYLPFPPPHPILSLLLPAGEFLAHQASFCEEMFELISL